MVHTSYQFPNAGDGVWLKSQQGRRLNIMITPVITVTSKRVQDLSVETRGCVFPDERELSIYHVYTQSSCLIQCRLEFILAACGCHMYFFLPPGKRLRLSFLFSPAYYFLFFFIFSSRRRETHLRYSGPALHKSQFP